MFLANILVLLPALASLLIAGGGAESLAEVSFKFPLLSFLCPTLPETRRAEHLRTVFLILIALYILLIR